MNTPCKKLLRSLRFLIVMMSALRASAQEDATVQTELYKPHFDVVDYKIYREHLPLDGAVVQHIPFRRDSLYGFMDKETGRMTIEPRFQQVFAAYREGAIVQDTDFYGLVGYDGRFIIPASFPNLFKEGGLYHGIADVSDADAPVKDAGANLHCYYDTTGRPLICFKSHRAQSFVLDDTLAWYRYGPRYSVFGRSGKVLKEFAYEEERRFVGIFNNTLVWESRDDSGSTYRGYDVRGRQSFSVRGDHHQQMVFRAADGMYGEMSDDGLFFSDGRGHYQPFAIVSNAVGFGFVHLLPYFYSNPFIRVQHRETERYGLLSKSGRLQLPCVYSYLGDYESGEVAFADSVTGLIGFMDTTGRVTVQPFLDPQNLDRADFADQPLVFSDGLCLGNALDAFSRKFYSGDQDDRGTPMAYYNRSGEMVVRLPDSIILAGPFSEGLAPVVGKSGALGFIDKQGAVVIPYKYAAAVAGAYPFPQIVLPRFTGGFAYLKSFKGYIDRTGKEYFSGKRVEDHYDFSH